MNEITELFNEHKNNTNDAVAAAILVLAEVIKYKSMVVDAEIVDYTIRSIATMDTMDTTD